MKSYLMTLMLCLISVQVKAADSVLTFRWSNAQHHADLINHGSKVEAGDGSEITQNVIEYLGSKQEGLKGFAGGKGLHVSFDPFDTASAYGRDLMIVEIQLAPGEPLPLSSSYLGYKMGQLPMAKYGFNFFRGLKAVMEPLGASVGLSASQQERYQSLPDPSYSYRGGTWTVIRRAPTPEERRRFRFVMRKPTIADAAQVFATFKTSPEARLRALSSSYKLSAIRNVEGGSTPETESFMQSLYIDHALPAFLTTDLGYVTDEFWREFAEQSRSGVFTSDLFDIESVLVAQGKEEASRLLHEKMMELALNHNSTLLNSTRLDLIVKMYPEMSSAQRSEVRQWLAPVLFSKRFESRLSTWKYHYSLSSKTASFFENLKNGSRNTPPGLSCSKIFVQH